LLDTHLTAAILKEVTRHETDISRLHELEIKLLQSIKRGTRGHKKSKPGHPDEI
jgi:hypothetical protein